MSYSGNEIDGGDKTVKNGRGHTIGRVIEVSSESETIRVRLSIQTRAAKKNAERICANVAHFGARGWRVEDDAGRLLGHIA